MKKLVVGLMLACTAGVASAKEVQLGDRPFLEAMKQLKPGDYIWAPELAAKGPTLVVVNLDSQRLAVFRNGVAIAASTVSSGKPGHETPTGVFTILQKNAKHFSKTYNNAPMPNMQRLTWSGIALHAGNLPGYPASHGCIRLPLEFSKLLFGETKLGMTVVLTSLPAIPHASAPPPMDGAAGNRPSITNARYEWNPDRAPHLNGDAIVSVVVSKADNRAVVMKGGVEIGSTPVYVEGDDRGAEAYVLESWDKAGPHWVNLRFSEEGKTAEPRTGEKKHFDVPNGFREALLKQFRPGSVVVVTPASLRAGSLGTNQTVIEADTK